MTSNGRVGRLTALALATGTLVAAGAGSAGATATTKTTFTATGGGSVIRLTVNLPAELPGIGKSITQDLVLTGSNVRTGDVPAAVSTSVLGANGNVPVVSGLLEKSVTAEYGKPAPTAINAFPAALNALGISGKLLALDSEATNPNVDGTVAHSLSSVANLRIEGAGNLQAVLDAVTAQLSTIINTALGTLPTNSSGSAGSPTAPVTSTVTSLLGSVTTQLDALTNNTTAPLTQAEKDAVTAVVAQLDALPAALSSKLKATATDTSLLSIKLIESEQTVSRHAGVITSSADQALTGISVLGGIVTVDGLSSSASAALGNGISTATPKAIGDSKLLHLNVNNMLTVDVTNGLTAALQAPALPSAVTTAVNGALAQITTLLNGVLGATLTGPAVSENVTTADKASSTVSAARLTVNPMLPGLNKPLFDKPLIDVQFVPASAQVLKAQSTTNITPTTVPAQLVTSEHNLAATGAELPLTGAVAAALMGLAVVLRRRRLADLAE